MTVMDELRDIRAKLLGEPPPISYDYYRGEEWDSELERLAQTTDPKHTSELWRRFLAFDGARRALEVEEERRARWKAELRQIAHRRAQVDPDSSDVAAFANDTTRQQMLEVALDTSAELHASLKVILEREQTAWGNAWHIYQGTSQELRRMERGAAPQIERWELDPHADKIEDLRRRQQHLTRSRG